MPRKATIQLKMHRQVVQSIPLDQADIECLIQGLRLVTPCTQRIDRLIDLLEQIRDGGQRATSAPGWTSYRPLESGGPMSIEPVGRKRRASSMLRRPNLSD
jgi:hypothetical protein